MDFKLGHHPLSHLVVTTALKTLIMESNVDSLILKVLCKLLLRRTGGDEGVMRCFYCDLQDK